MRVVALDDAEYLRRAVGQRLPIEQTPLWDAYDRVAAGRAPWGRFLVSDATQAIALLSLSAYRGRGFRYLWARHGPVWLVEPTPQQEHELREAVTALVRRADRRLVFVRLHARHRADDLHELLQTMTYDRTVVIDLTGSEDEVFARLRGRGRRDIRKGLKDTTLAVTEETGLDRPGFDELYEVLSQTSSRDRFGIAPGDVYWRMLGALGPQHVRLFVARRAGQVLSWVIVTVHDGLGVAYYGASSAEGRRWATDLLHWRVMQRLREDGVVAYDLMGIDSERAPALRGVTGFKTKFADPTDIDGAWDVPARPLTYRALVRALRIKRAVAAGVRRARHRSPE